MASEALEDTDLPSVSSDRRIWQKRTPAQGSGGMVLKVFGILYDAERPLTRDEIVTQLDAQLNVYERAYLEAWDLRRIEKLKRLKPPTTAVLRSSKYSTRVRPIQSWFTNVFLKRVRQGHSLVRDAEGRYRPGPTPPRVLTFDGRLLDYTPPVRHELRQTDHDAGNGHLALLEWSKHIKAPEFATVEARAQVLMFLLRRLFIGDTNTKKPLNELRVAARLRYILRWLDTPGVQRVLLQQVFTDLLAALGQDEHR